MANKIDQLRAQFYQMGTAQKLQFIERLKPQVATTKNSEYKAFLNECIKAYNAEINSGGAAPRPSLQSHATGGTMGNLIIKGHGNDNNMQAKMIIGMVVLGVVGIVLALVLINVVSSYHAGFDFRRIHGVVFFGDRIIRSGTLSLIALFLISSGVIGAIMKMQGRFKSQIAVYEGGISGLSVKKERFTLTYNEISSVHSQEDDDSSVDNLRSININASGKVFQVHSSKWSEIVAEINMRRRV